MPLFKKQKAAPVPKHFFDFHVHPSLKASLCETNYRDPWLKIQLRTVLNKFFGRILNSQSNFSQLDQQDLTISVIALHAVEKGFAERALFNKVAPRISNLDSEVLHNVRDGKIAYYKMLCRDLETLKSGGRKNFIVVEKPEQLEEALKAEHVFVPAVEGGHSFKSFAGKQEDESLTLAEIEEVVKTYKAFVEQVKPLYLTLTHLTRQQTATHAYGVRAKVGGMVILGGDRSFKPSGKGIWPLGWRLIEESDAQQVLIDIKHMSLLSRLQYYEYRNSVSQAAPIVATHMGITGHSWKNIPVRSIGNSEDADGLTSHRCFIKEGLSDTKFNPWTIGLFDEEIIEIVKSGGMIGISLDRRILGAGPVYDEFFSTEEYALTKTHFKESVQVPTGYRASNLVDKDDMDGNPDEGSLMDKDDSLPDERDIDFLANNILHVFKVINESKTLTAAEKANSFSQLCVGSDLDGIIDPIKITVSRMFYGFFKKDEAVSAENLHVLEQELCAAMLAMIKKNNEELAFLAGFDVQDWCRKFFFDNGKRFILQWYKVKAQVGAATVVV